MRPQEEIVNRIIQARAFLYGEQTKMVLEEFLNFENVKMFLKYPDEEDWAKKDQNKETIIDEIGEHIERILASLRYKEYCRVVRLIIGLSDLVWLLGDEKTFSFLVMETNSSYQFLPILRFICLEYKLEKCLNIIERIEE